eukprot:m.35960 g.35960  ORF g.35960 m.35960 type:complete len:60 (+) comp12431_c0_seq3:1530-1709(+)
MKTKKGNGKVITAAIEKKAAAVTESINHGIGSSSILVFVTASCLAMLFLVVVTKHQHRP